MCLNGASTCRLAAIVAAVLLCVVGGPLLLAGAVLFSQGGPKTETAERGNNFLIGLTLLVVGTVLLIVGVVLLMLLCCTGVFDDDQLEHQVEEKDRPQERPIIVHTTIVREKRVLRLSKKVKPNPLMQDIGTSDNCQQTDIEQKAKKHKERSFANRSVNSTPRGFHDEFHRSQRFVVGTPMSDQTTRPPTERSCHRAHLHREKPYYWDHRTAFHNIPHK